MKTYWLTPGDSSINPSTFTGLSPTMITFVNNGGSNVTSPGITESPAASGVYRFTYGPTIGMFFVVDWGNSIANGFRYTKGALDPIQAVDERVGGILGNNDSIGSTSTDPSTIVGFLKRNQEIQEGNAEYLKATGIWSIYSRGSTTLLATKTLTNNTTTSTKT